jgi:hypothetical protein
VNGRCSRPEIPDGTSNFPLIQFVSEGYVPQHFPCCSGFPFLGPGQYRVGPLPKLSRRQCAALYPRGNDFLRRLGWKRSSQVLNEVRPGLRTPLGLLFREVLCRHDTPKSLASTAIRPIKKQPDVPYPMSKNMSLLPHIVITVHQEDLLSLLDSGSEVTCINEEQFEILSAKVKIPTLPVASTFIQGATGQQSSRVKSQAWIEFSLGDKIASSGIFLVVKNLIRPVILGMDWFSRVKGKLDFDANSLTFMSNNVCHAVPFHIDSFLREDDSPPTSSPLVSATSEPLRLDLSRTITPMEVLREKVDAISLLSPSQKSQLFDVLVSHQTAFNGLPGRTNEYVHVIKMHDATPFIKRAYPIAFSLRPEVEKVIQQMLQLGVIKREASPFASPMTVVRKKDGSVRICLDARWINQQMVSDCEAPRPPEDLFHSFPSMRFMSAIDLRSSYWQIPLSAESTQYTAFLFNGQSYTYQVLPFGLKTAVGSFSRAMDVILGPEVREFTINYIDDLLIVSQTFEEHLRHLGLVLQRLQDAGMTINLEKSAFLQQEVHFLGHVLSPNGVSTDPAKVEAIQKFPVPKTQKHLRAFLGLCGYYRRFSDRFSHETAPLTQLLRKGTRWNWTSVEQQAFERTKGLFLEAVILHFPNFSKTFYLQTDGSGVALGVELYQLDDAGEHGVIGFASRMLRGPELLYTVTEKELLAIIFGLQKFRTILLGHRIVIRTDHYALKFLKQCRLLNDRLTRWSLLLNEFDYDVEHIRGKDNVVADTLSRFPPDMGSVPIRGPNVPIVGATVMSEVEVISAVFTASGLGELQAHFQNLRQLQVDDPFLGPIFNARIQGGVPPDHDRLFPHFRIHQDVLIFVHPVDRTPKIALPEILVDDVIRIFHEQYGHFGITKIYSLMNRHFFFRRMRSRIERFVKSCDTCQKCKFPNRALSGEMHPIIAENPGDLVTVDYYGPLPESRSRVTYIFVVIDSFSKFVRLYPLRRAQAKISAQKIVNDFHRIIPVKAVLSDHGTQFQSRQWQDTLRSWGIRPTFSTIRHPQSNPTERVMKELSRLFRTYCSRSHAGWSTILSKIELLFNVTPDISTGYSPYEIVSGKNPSNPLSDLADTILPANPPKAVYEIRADVRARLRQAAEQRKKWKKSRGDVFHVDDFVLLRENPISDAANKVISKFCPLYSGPYVVDGVPHPNVYALRDPTTNERKGNYNISNLKLYYRRT